MNEEIMSKIFPEAMALIKEGKCPTCKMTINANDFTDQLSVKEFQISGMCQRCQDATFGNDQLGISPCCGAPITELGRCSDCKENI